MKNISNYTKSILNEIKLRASKINIDTFDHSKEYLSRYSFVTKNSADIKVNLLKLAEKEIDRKQATKQLIKFVGSEAIAYDMERGIFEFALVQIIIGKLQESFVTYIYQDKLEDICLNLDITNKHINNQTLMDTVKSGTFRPFFVAFLSPGQMHPKRWDDIIKKQKKTQETLANICTTDRYRCSKCGSRKFTSYELQLRGSDEPTSKFLTCQVCYRTFIL